MNSNFDIIKLLSIPILCFIFSFSAKANTANQTPLDSIKQVVRALNIPYDISEEWIEELEDLEDYQDSPKFKRLLTNVNQQIQAYLLDQEGYQPEKKQKRKLKDRLDKIGKGISTTVNKGINQAEILVDLEKGRAAEGKGNYAEAIHHYKKVVAGFESQQNWKKWIEYQTKIADLMASRLFDYDGALAILPGIKEKMRELGDGAGMRKIDIKIKNLEKNLDIKTVKEAPPVILPTPSTTSPKPPVVATPTPTPQVSVISAQIKKQEEEFAKQQKAIADMKKKVAEDEARLREAERIGKSQSEIAALRREVKNSKQKSLDDEKKAASLKKNLEVQKDLLAAKKLELEKKEKDQLKLYGGLAILGLLLFSTFFMYRSKKKDHKKLEIAYDELAEAQEELKLAEQKIKGLLDQQVSGAVAAELMATDGNKATKHERRFVCIMFLDIRNFTPFVESKTPEEIIEYQNNVLGFMMEKVIEHKGIVNTVLGDGFMATFGAPISAGNDCLQAYKAAVEIMQMVREKSRTGQIPATKIGIGLHAGNVVAGNVGTKTRKQYLVTGNTVIIASRLEQLNKQYGSSLIISREVVERLPTAMNLPKVFDKVMVKGRSKPVEIVKYG